MRAPGSRRLGGFFRFWNHRFVFLEKLFLFWALNSERFEKMSRFLARAGSIFAVDIHVCTLRTPEKRKQECKTKGAGQADP